MTVNMKPTVYVETSVFSFYYDERDSAAVIAMREWTRAWWSRKQDFDVLTSTAVLAELDRGTLPHRTRALEMAKSLPALPVTPGVEEVVSFYIQHKLMPNDPVGDPLHLALASMNKCDYLLTWNCNHLANANKFGHIHRLNAILGIFTPVLTTPLELLGGIEP